MQDLSRIRPTADLSPTERAMFIGVPKGACPTGLVRAAALDPRSVRPLGQLDPTTRVAKRIV